MLREDFTIPPGFYININSAPNPRSERYESSSYGVIVDVYRSLDKSHGAPPVEHTISIGDFKIEGVKEMSGNELLEKIRNGIRERITKSELPITIIDRVTHR